MIFFCFRGCSILFISSSVIGIIFILRKFPGNEFFKIELTSPFCYLKNKRPTWCHLPFYFTSYVLSMFQTLIYPSSGTCDYSVELPHWSYCSWFDVCWSFGVVGLEWYPCCWLQPATTPTQPHQNSNTHRTKNNTTNVVIQQNSRKLLMMDILMSETCWAHKKW